MGQPGVRAKTLASLVFVLRHAGQVFVPKHWHQHQAGPCPGQTPGWPMSCHNTRLLARTPGWHMSTRLAHVLARTRGWPMSWHEHQAQHKHQAGQHVLARTPAWPACLGTITRSTNISWAKTCWPGLVFMLRRPTQPGVHAVPRLAGQPGVRAIDMPASLAFVPRHGC